MREADRCHPTPGWGLQGMPRPGPEGGGREYKYCEPGSHHWAPALAAEAPTHWGSPDPKGPSRVLGQAGGLHCGRRTQTAPPGTEPPPLPPRLLGGLLGPLPPQPHKRLGLAVTLPALQQLQDRIPCKERCLRVRLARRGAWRVAGSAVPPRPPEPRDGPTQPRSQDSLADKTGEAFAVPLGSSASRNAQPSCSTRG